MAPRPFSQDGAVGASDGTVSPTSTTGALADPSNAWRNTGHWSSNGVYSPDILSDSQVQQLLNANPIEGYSGSNTSSTTPGSQALQNDAYSYSSPLAQNTGGFYRSAAFFEDGGSMPDISNDTSGNDLVSLALATVDSALEYGRNKYGLGAGGTQQASAIPMVPGSQSESGTRTQPSPGPLPPTSNPFGRRPTRPLGQNEDSSGQQTAGAIPDDQDQEAA